MLTRRKFIQTSAGFAATVTGIQSVAEALADKPSPNFKMKGVHVNPSVKVIFVFRKFSTEEKLSLEYKKEPACLPGFLDPYRTAITDCCEFYFLWNSPLLLHLRSIGIHPEVSYSFYPITGNVPVYQYGIPDQMIPDRVFIHGDLAHALLPFAENPDLAEKFLCDTPLPLIGRRSF